MTQPEPTVITIGNFDGVHRGHQALLRRARHVAHAHGCRVLALTFDPHPVMTLRPGQQPPKLSRLHERLHFLRDAGADRIEAFKPTRDILDLPPEPFLNILLENYHPIAIVEGEDFHFGRKREGDMAMLQQLGRKMGFKAITEPKVSVSLADRTIVPVSSTLVRWLVKQGRVLDASLALARPFQLVGTIVQGEQRGRTLDFPTVNLNLDDVTDQVIPAYGVYAGFADIEGCSSATAAISVGMKPTFGQKQLTIEAHLLDFDQDVYGRTMTLSFLRWVRDQIPFSSADALKTQLQRDVAEIRQWHQHGLLQTPRPSYHKQEPIKSHAT